MDASLLKNAILGQHRSIRAFAEKIGVSSSTIQSAIDNDKVGKMAVETVIKMCDELGIDVKTFKPVTIPFNGITNEEAKLLKLSQSI